MIAPSPASFTRLVGIKIWQTLNSFKKWPTNLSYRFVRWSPYKNKNFGCVNRREVTPRLSINKLNWLFCYMVYVKFQFVYAINIISKLISLLNLHCGQYFLHFFSAFEPWWYHFLLMWRFWCMFAGEIVVRRGIKTTWIRYILSIRKSTFSSLTCINSSFERGGTNKSQGNS